MLAILFAFRAMWVAGMDIHVAGALVTQTPLGTAFQTMALTLLPTFCLLGAIALFFIAAPLLRTAFQRIGTQLEADESPFAESLDILKDLVGPLIGIGAGCLLLWTLILRWPDPAVTPLSFVINIVTILPTVGILILRFAGPSKRPLLRVLPGALLGLAALSAAYQLAIALTSSSMWLPPEQVSTDSGSYVMYVLSADDKRTVAFIPANRAVVQIPTAEVRQRQFCSPYFRGDVATSLWGEAKMGSCQYHRLATYPVDIPVVPVPFPTDTVPDAPDRLP